MLKRRILSVIFFASIFVLNSICFAEPMNDSSDLGFNSWELLIYRPKNNQPMNDIWCWLTISDENGNDVTFDAVRDAFYFYPNPSRKNLNVYGPYDPSYFFHEWSFDQKFRYRKNYYLSGGMAMKLNIKPGKYFISFKTPKEKSELLKTSNDSDWLSNSYCYDTKSPLRVIFVSPVANDNFFYTGAWHISDRAPKFKDFTIPEVEN